MSNNQTVKILKRDDQLIKVHPDGTEENITNKKPTPSDIQRLDKMTDQDVAQSLANDPDYDPDEFTGEPRPLFATKFIRKNLDMTQREFSETYKIPLQTLKDWERQARKPDATAIAYLKVIEHEPDLVRKVFVRYNQGA
jgi:putative transcriptional regulator